MTDEDFTNFVGSHLLSSSTATTGKNIVAMDGFLHTYHDEPRIDWVEIHLAALSRDNSVTHLTRPYWIDGQPFSNLAFLGTAARKRLALDPETPDHVLAIMANDPAAAVRDVVDSRLRNEIPRTQTAGRAIALQPHSSSEPPPRKRYGWQVAVGVAAILLIVGFASGYSHEVVDQEARPATQSEAPTGRFNVDRTSDQICGGGEDYLSCVNSHVAVYNSSCVGRQLTVFGKATCDSLSSFVDNIKAQYDGCGYGCETRVGDDGTWGWPYLSVTAETELVSNNDAVARITHTETCSFNLGPIKIGSCTR